MPSTTLVQEAVDCSWGNENACENYVKINSCDFHRYCNQYSTMRLIGDVTNKRVLDLPSGPGHYACRLLSIGAEVVTSVDIDKNFVAVAKSAISNLGDVASRWNGVVANACELTEYPGGPFDVLRANFLLENFKNVEDMRACARNLFNNLAPNGRYVGLWAPGAHTPTARKIVYEITGMDTSDITNMKSGDPCKITYSHLREQGAYEWFLRSEEEFKGCLEEAGFVDVQFHPLQVDPTYTGQQDLRKFVKHVGNRNITAVKPASQ